MQCADARKNEQEGECAHSTHADVGPYADARECSLRIYLTGRSWWVSQSKTFDHASPSSLRYWRGMGIAGDRRDSVRNRVLRSFTFQIQPAAKFKKPNLGDRLNLLFFAPKIMTQRALRASALRSVSLDERLPKLARGWPLAEITPNGDLGDRLDSKHGNIETRPTGLRKGDTVLRRHSSLTPVATDDAAPSPPPFEQRECEGWRGEKVKKSTYKLHSISATEFPNGQWVATFSRLDGAPIVVNGSSRMALTTDSYLASFLAVADAEMEIDEIVARGGTVRATRSVLSGRR